MGQKVNPISFRLGNLFTWSSRWYADKKTYSKHLLDDVMIRKFLESRLRNAGLVKVEIERSINATKIRLFVSRPGVVIGKGGSNLEELKKALARKMKINLNDPKGPRFVIEEIVEVKNPDASAKLIVEKISEQLVKRVPHRRVVSQAVERAMQSGAEGIKIVLSGRIGGADIGRVEKYSKGKVPTQTLRSNIDYYHMPSPTKSGYVGIKVWVYKGEEAIK